MFGRQPRLFIKLQQNDNEELDILEFPNSNPSDESVASRINYMTTVKEKVDSNIAKAQAKQKKYYEMRRAKGYKSFDSKIGMKVLVKNNKKQGRKGSQLEEDWLGPYDIHSILDN